MIDRKWLLTALLIGIGALAYFGWPYLRPRGLPEGFTSSNGRIEATEIDIAAKLPGRIAEVLAREGDFVSAGQVLARMDTEVLKAQLREAEADLRRAQTNVETARSNVSQRESEKSAAESVVAQREAEMKLATRKYERAHQLLGRKVLAQEEYDTEEAAFYSAKASLERAIADVAATEAAISTAKSVVIQTEAAVVSSEAKIERIQADLDDSILTSPRNGRVQFRVAEPGEVLSAGGRVLNMVDLTDVFMTFFLPTEEAGRIRIGAEVRLVLDPAPELVIPAQVSYVADVAQFTPKTVETAVERQKLMFRIKAHISPELLEKYVRSVKTGVPGVAYVRIDENAEWPSSLKVRLPR